MKKGSIMDAEALDQLFDAGEDITPHVDLSTAQRPNLEARKVQVELPAWVIDSLTREAKKTGVSLQSIIKIWLAERATHDGAVSAH